RNMSCTRQGATWRPALFQLLSSPGKGLWLRRFGSVFKDGRWRGARRHVPSSILRTRSRNQMGDGDAVNCAGPSYLGASHVPGRRRTLFTVNSTVGFGDCDVGPL